MNILEEWNNLNPLTTEENKILCMHMTHDPNIKSDWEQTPVICQSKDEWKKLTKEWFDLMLGANITENDHYLTFNTCCSNFIRELFQKHVDDDTLVISTDCEHPTVKECLSKCKNTLILSQRKDIRTFNFKKIEEKLKHFKKVFVYIIAVRNDTGELTPQSFMLKLKQLLLNTEHIIVLDDVQGMFIVPRDYTIYDYVLGTGHVIVNKFDLGIMISKKFYKGINALNWGKNYLIPLKIVLKRLKKLTCFREYCNTYFQSYLTNTNVSKELNAGHIFYIEGKKFILPTDFSLKLEKYNVLIMTPNIPTPGIRLRALGYITNPEVFSTALKIFQYSLDTKKETLSQKDIEAIINENTLTMVK